MFEIEVDNNEVWFGMMFSIIKLLQNLIWVTET